jgi:hypothetical protein
VISASASFMPSGCLALSISTNQVMIHFDYGT